jgi:hypothetical protein
VWQPASDDELRSRQSALQAEAGEVLAELDRAGLFDSLSRPLLGGSYVSGLMCWRDLDIMVLVGPDFAPRDVLRLLQRAVDVPGVVGLEYHDERGPRCPTDAVRDERYHVLITLGADRENWRIDLSLWLHDPHANVTAWHEALRERITDEQRGAVLRIKDVWHRLPSYPDEVSGLEIYTAVLDHGVRTPAQFGAWLARQAPTPTHVRPVTPGA